MTDVKVNMLLMFGGILAGPAGGVLHAICTNLERPRLEAVRTLTEKLLREGLKQYEVEQLEYLKFYMTPEWRSLRATTIRRKGKTCNRCGMKIRTPKDVTVDHILPRSVYPDRALDPKNLQVLCRSCNSAKGARMETESDVEI
ncbi:MAG: HNH endonuclease [Verrucomicrobia bacterium]|nr:HNH endonuclease [Verrucomicrobiota bacterium]